MSGAQVVSGAEPVEPVPAAGAQTVPAGGPDDVPALVPAARLSPRSRLARLAGEALAAPTSAGRSADAPVDAPATTALPRPRRKPAPSVPGSDGARDGIVEPGGIVETGGIVEPGGAVTAVGVTSPPGTSAEGDEGRRPHAGGAAAAEPEITEAPTEWIPPEGLNELPDKLSPRPEADGGSPRRPRGLVRALVVGLAAIVSCALFLVAGLGYGATKYYETQLSRTDLGAGRVEGTRPPAVPHGRETWLLVGSDVRTGADSAEVGGARSDTMMIGYLGANGSTTLVSVPRDLKVTIPAFTDSAGKHHSARTDKINAAFSLGGPALLVRTLENVTDVRIDHFAEIDFGGFKQMSDVLGGIEVCMVKDPFKEYVAEDGKTSTNLNDPMSGFRGQVGPNLLEGDNALAFVRQRHGFVNGDYSRIQRQQAFLAAVFRKVNSGNLLTDPGKLAGFLNAVTGAVTVDSGTSLTDLKTLAERLHAMNAGQVHFTTIPLSGAQSAPVYYALYDPATVRGFIKQILASDDATAAVAGSPTPSAAPSPTVDPSQIRVTVLNGSPTGGTANKAAAKLRAAGYQVVRVGTNASRQVASTEVLYPQSLAAAASRLLADIPGARLVPNTEAAGSSGGALTTSPASPSATATATSGMITLVVGEDMVTGDTSVIATPTAATRAPGAVVPYYTQAPVSAAAGCVK